jgi:four helix bundle protein
MTATSMPPFLKWVAGADKARTGDPLWSVQAYRLGLYAVACHTFDRGENAELRKAAALDQLTRSGGSIPANISEGYSRSSIADRTRFYGYALGSTREAIDWYDSLNLELGSVAEDRQATLTQIRRLLLTTLKNARPEGTTDVMRDVASRRHDDAAP